MAQWNGTAVARWNRLHQAIERRLGVKLACFKVVEVQDRGALHLHVLIRVAEPVRMRVSMLRSLAIRHGYGHAVDVQEISSEHAAWYVAKYASKSSDARESAPFVHPKTGEVGPGKWRSWTSTRGRRRWGESMADVRAAQAAWRRESSESTVEDPTTAKPAAGGDGEAGALDPKSPCYANASLEPPTGVHLPPM